MMKILNSTIFTFIATITMTANAKIVIGTPAANAVKDKTHLAFEVNGSCTAGQILKISAVDSAGKSTAFSWTQCQPWGFSVPLNITALKDGAIKVNAIQDAAVNPQSASISITKSTGAVVVVPPVVTAPSSSIVIGTPAANAVKNAANLNFEVNGSCTAGDILKINASDSAGAATIPVWTQCQPWGFSVNIDISALKDGAITVLVLQNATSNAQSQTVSITKSAGSVVVSPPVVVATPTPVVVATPASSSAFAFGVGGHTGYTAYPLSQTEAVFSLLNSKNIRKYRIDVNAGTFTVLDTMVPLAKKYGITLRPMIYPTTQAAAYTFAKRYANDIKIWEIGNEQDYSRTGAQDRINAMVATYKGIKQASDELGAKLETTINVMGCNSDYTGSGATCPGDKTGAMWFTEMARNSGFLFDHVSFHYYPHYGDKGYFMDLILSQLRGFAVKYNTKIFYDEVNCAEIYDGNTTGGFAGDKGCYDSIKQIFDILKTSYSDVLAEVTMYELFDNTDIGGVEGHFGLLYNINTPKPNFNLLVEYANKP